MGGLLAGDGCGVLQGGRLGWEIGWGCEIMMLRGCEAARLHWLGWVLFFLDA